MNVVKPEIDKFAVNNLGIWFDFAFSLSKHRLYAKIMQFRYFRLVRLFLNCDTSILVANARVSRWLVYCNSLLEVSKFNLFINYNVSKIVWSELYQTLVDTPISFRFLHTGFPKNFVPYLLTEIFIIPGAVRLSVISMLQQGQEKVLPVYYFS